MFGLGGLRRPTTALWRHPTVGDLNGGGGATPEIEGVRAVAVIHLGLGFRKGWWVIYPIH